MHVNHQWDLEYREQGEAFRRYRFDSQQAQSETLDLIARLKAEKEQLSEEIRGMKYEQSRKRMLEQGGSVEMGKVHSLQRKIKEQEEEIGLLRQQVCMCVRACACVCVHVCVSYPGSLLATPLSDIAKIHPRTTWQRLLPDTLAHV